MVVSTSISTSVSTNISGNVLPSISGNVLLSVSGNVLEYKPERRRPGTRIFQVYRDSTPYR